MRYRDLIETPIEMYSYGEPTGGASSFRDDDKNLTTSEKPVAKIKKTWNTSVADVELYLFDVGVDPSKALDLALMGHETDEFNDIIDLQGLAGIVKPKDGAITVVLTQNEGANRIPLTGWMIAHRLWHAFQESKATEISQRPHDVQELVEKTFRGVARDIEEMVHYIDPADVNDIACLLGTTRACRQFNLNGAGELLPETFAQFMLTGSVKLNRLAPNIKANGKAFRVRKDFSEEIEYREKILNRNFAQIIEMAKGRVFTL